MFEKSLEKTGCLRGASGSQVAWESCLRLQPAISQEDVPSLDSGFPCLLGDAQYMRRCKSGQSEDFIYNHIRKIVPFASACRSQSLSSPTIYVPLTISHEVLQLFHVEEGTATYFKCDYQRSQSNRGIYKDLLPGKADRGSVDGSEKMVPRKTRWGGEEEKGYTHLILK